MKTGPKPKPAYERIVARVEKITATGCWLFKGSRNCSGHGNVRVWSEAKQKWVTTNAHIVTAEHHHGPLPDGKTEWRHTCDTANCVAPHHLIPGTHKENMQDAIDRNRGMFGRFKEETTREKEYEECPF
jgi:hypothetical protein